MALILVTGLVLIRATRLFGPRFGRHALPHPPFTHMVHFTSSLTVQMLTPSLHGYFDELTRVVCSVIIINKRHHMNKLIALREGTALPVPLSMLLLLLFCVTTSQIASLKKATICPVNQIDNSKYFCFVAKIYMMPT